MSTYTQILYQIVFSTKNRDKVLIKSGRETLYKYIWGILKNNKCHLYRLNGVEDHIHMVIHLHPTVALSTLVKDIKVASTIYCKSENLFPGFQGWQEGYGAFTYAFKEKGRLVEYVKNQEIHHKQVSFKDEYRNLLNEHGVQFEEKYLL
ncbi:IS200/IS605 family transposase [Fulvivirga kasyanovii]|uniref:IS200/IS605 family transposase n=1 Tax=Fulvivirga kasyanovii TaxID=396812 RepID=A0ABW9RXZ1_9BACT|nr:IS200/IS605 family transposase [Fulvivirga kasyanovii]MTI28556.1 IS200/IS605 family transposase [Fulvivirga kasyanovii]